MYLETGVGQVFKPRSKYHPPRFQSLTARWRIEVPYRQKFADFRQELSKSVGSVVSQKDDKAWADKKLLSDKEVERNLKGLHARLAKRRSPRLKEGDAVELVAELVFWKQDLTDLYDVSVRE